MEVLGFFRPMQRERSGLERMLTLSMITIRSNLDRDLWPPLGATFRFERPVSLSVGCRVSRVASAPLDTRHLHYGAKNVRPGG